MIYFFLMRKLDSIGSRVIEYSFYLLFFLVPLIMTPWNYELFEFNKMLLVYFFTIIIVCGWLIKMIVAKKFLFRKSFWDIPLLVFFGSQFISFLISIDHHTSLWGYYSRFNGGLVSIISYLLLYWALVSNLNKKQTLNVIYYVLASTVIVSLYGIAEHFGIDANAWVQDVRNRVFSTLGQPNWLAAWLIALIPLTWALTLENWQLGFKNWRFYLYPLAFAIYFLCLLYTKSRSGLLGFGVTMAAFWPLIIWLKRKQIKNIVKPIGVMVGLILIFALLVGTPWTPILTNFKNQKSNVKTEEKKTENGQISPILISESSDIRKVVWKGAIEVWKHSPIFGTGVETFAYSYYWQRPREHNDLSEWDFLYNKAHNEYLNYAATTGTIGLLAYLGLIGTFIFWSLKKFTSKKINEDFTLYILNYSLFAGFASILVTNFFGFSVVAVNLLFFLLPALVAVLTSKEASPKKAGLKIKKAGFLALTPWQLITLIATITFSFYLLYLNGRYWYADTRFALGDKLDKGSQTNQAFIEYQKAVKIRPEPIYRDELGVTAASLAASAFQQEQATLSSQLVDFAIKQSDAALKISPYNINFWKNRTRLFYSLSEIDSKYNQEALKSLIRASELAPTDAKIAYNLGVLYSKLGQEETAIQMLEKTVQLKPNYDQARYALALFYEKKDQNAKAKEQYQYILEKINPNYESAIEKLKKLK